MTMPNNHYVVRFVRKDGKPDEEYFYHTKADALYHFNLFLNDDSGLYRMIAIYNDATNFVEDMIPFDDSGRPLPVLSEGSIVRLRPEYRSKGEERYLFRVTNLNERMGHCCIVCLNSALSLPSSEIVGVQMVYPVCEPVPIWQ